MTPTCLALVLCESVERTGPEQRPVIVRAFEFFEAASLPSPSRAFTVWMQFRDGNGRTTMALIVEHVPPHDLEVEAIVVVRFSLDFEDPNVVMEHEAVFETGIPLDHAGRYRLRLTADGITVMQRYFGVLRRADDP